MLSIKPLSPELKKIQTYKQHFKKQPLFFCVQVFFGCFFFVWKKIVFSTKKNNRKKRGGCFFRVKKHPVEGEKQICMRFLENFTNVSFNL